MEKLKTSPTIENEVKHIVATHFNVSESELCSQTEFIKDLNADSLDTIELALAFEDEFLITIMDAEISCLRSIENAVSLIQQKLTSHTESA